MILNKEEDNILKLAKLLLASKHTIAFTGAGVSVASGIPPFRGEGGIWTRYDPEVLELSHYYRNPQVCWKTIKKIFYDSMVGVKPNSGHYALTELQHLGLLKGIYTQNIDNLHQESGSLNVYEFHGSSKFFLCRKCHKRFSLEEIELKDEYPKCLTCAGLLKPDFVFFSEELPRDVLTSAYSEAEQADLMLIIGCSGEVYPANQIPFYTKESGGTVVEINPQKTHYTDQICNFRIAGKSQDTLQTLVDTVKELRRNSEKK